MKTATTQSSQLDSSRSMTTSFRSRRLLVKKKDRPEFDLLLEELLKEETKEWDEYPVLLPQHGLFWDNGYEDIEEGGRL